MAVTKFSVATNRRFKDKQSGEWKEETDWTNVALWRAENLANYLTKGKQLYVEGRLQTRSYEDKDGKKVYSTEVVGDEVILLGGQAAGAAEPAAMNTRSSRFRSPGAHNGPRLRHSPNPIRLARALPMTTFRFSLNQVGKPATLLEGLCGHALALGAQSIEGRGTGFGIANYASSSADAKELRGNLCAAAKKPVRTILGGQVCILRVRVFENFGEDAFELAFIQHYTTRAILPGFRTVDSRDD